MVRGGLDVGNTAPASSLTGNVDAYRWYRSAMRSLVHDAMPIVPAIAKAAADVLLFPMDVSALHASHNNRRAAAGVLGQPPGPDSDAGGGESAETAADRAEARERRRLLQALPADLDASHRRAIGAAAALESMCRWRTVEAEQGDVGVAPLQWEVVLGAVTHLVRRLPMQNGGDVGGRSAAHFGAAGAPGMNTVAGPSWAPWTNLDVAVDHTVAAVTVERHRRMFLALASAARGLSAIVHHEHTHAKQTGTNGRLAQVMERDRPGDVLEALLGVERVAGDAKMVQATAAAAATAADDSTPGSGELPLEGLAKNAGAAVATCWAAVHALASVPLLPLDGDDAADHLRHDYSPLSSTMTTRDADVPSHFRLHDREDDTLDPTAALRTETLPRLLAGAVVGLSTVPTEHVLAPLRVLATLLTKISPDESSVAMAVECIEVARNTPKRDQFAATQFRSETSFGAGSDGSFHSHGGGSAMATLGRHVVVGLLYCFHYDTSTVH